MIIGFKEKFVRSKTNLLFAFSMFWFVVRVIPRPSRIMYPCQRTTLALIFIRLGIGVSIVATTLTEFARHRIVKVLVVAMLFVEIAFPTVLVSYYNLRYSMIAPSLMTLMDMQYGFSKQTIVRVHSNGATYWDFTSDYYWQHVNQSVVDRMVEEGVKTLTNASDLQGAWETILDYTPGEIVGIKINGNDFPPYINDPNTINTLPQIINSVIEGVKGIGVPESNIWVIEPTGSAGKLFFQYYYDIINGAYPNVQLLDADDISFGSHTDLLVNFPYASDRYITDQMRDIDHLIMIPIMKAITPDWGVTGAIKLMQGNIENQAPLHDFIGLTSADNPHVLIYQNPHIIGKTRLLVGDGLFGMWTGMHFGGGLGGTDILQPPNHRNETPNRWITFNNGAPNTLFFGVDPVAFDSVMYDHILAERNAQDQIPGQSLAPFNEPQLIAGEAAGLGIREHGPPYTHIDYREIDLDVPTHDLAVADIAFSPAILQQGSIVDINVTVANQGGYSEIFNATLFANATIIDRLANINVTKATSVTIAFSWNTTGFDEGDYIITAYVPPVLGETDTADNTKAADRMVTVLSLGHDVTIKSVNPVKTVVGQGYSLSINITAKKYGSFSETFDITAYVNTTAIETIKITLVSGNSTTITFTWNTASFAKGNYAISAYAWPVPGETDTADNTKVDGWVFVTLPGDVDGDRDVDVYDIVLMASIYGVSKPDPLYDPNCDIDGDGDVDIYDIVAAAGNYGKSW